MRRYETSAQVVEKDEREYEVHFSYEYDSGDRMQPPSHTFHVSKVIDIETGDDVTSSVDIQSELSINF